jgi:N-sulfoglucosamine sulfohydrolase
MDYGVGLILQELEQRGFTDDTLIIFVSDNGAPFLKSKTTLYDAGVTLPLIVKSPTVNGGVVNPNLVSFLDISPTCIDWVGASDDEIKISNTGKSPSRLGTSFLRTLDVNEILSEKQWQHHIFGSHTFHEDQNYWPTRFLRTHKYKYHRNIAWRLEFPFGTNLYGSLSWDGIRNGQEPVMIGQRPLDQYFLRGPEELFDFENDPEEIHNLAHDVRFAPVLDQCRKKVEAWQYQTSDVWLFKDGISAITSKKHQTLGLKLPDRFNFDLSKPGNKEGPHWSPPTAVMKGASPLVYSG